MPLKSEKRRTSSSRSLISKKDNRVRSLLYEDYKPITTAEGTTIYVPPYGATFKTMYAINSNSTEEKISLHNPREKSHENVEDEVDKENEPVTLPLLKSHASSEDISNANLKYQDSFVRHSFHEINDRSLKKSNFPESEVIVIDSESSLPPTVVIEKETKSENTPWKESLQKFMKPKKKPSEIVDADASVVDENVSKNDSDSSSDKVKPDPEQKQPKKSFITAMFSKKSSSKAATDNIPIENEASDAINDKPTVNQRKQSLSQSSSSSDSEKEDEKLNLESPFPETEVIVIENNSELNAGPTVAPNKKVKFENTNWKESFQKLINPKKKQPRNVVEADASVIRENQNTVADLSLLPGNSMNKEKDDSDSSSDHSSVKSDTEQKPQKKSFITAIFSKKQNSKNNVNKALASNLNETSEEPNNSVDLNKKTTGASDSSSSSDSEPERKAKKPKFGIFFSKKNPPTDTQTVIEKETEKNVQAEIKEDKNSAKMEGSILVTEPYDNLTPHLADTESSPESLKQRKKFTDDIKKRKSSEDVRKKSSMFTFGKAAKDNKSDSNEVATPGTPKIVLEMETAIPQIEEPGLESPLERRSWRMIDGEHEMEIIDEEKLRKVQEKNQYRKRKSKSWALLPFLNKKEEDKEIKINGIIGVVEDSNDVTNKKKYKRSESSENMNARKSGLRNSFQNLFNLNKNKRHKQKEEEKCASETSDSDSDPENSPTTFNINNDEVEEKKYKRISSEPQLMKLRTLDPEELLKDEDTRKSLQNLSSEIPKTINFDSESSSGSSDSSAAPLKINKFGNKIKSLFGTNDSYSVETMEHSRTSSLSSVDSNEETAKHKKSRFLEFFRNLIKRNPKQKRENVKKERRKSFLNFFNPPKTTKLERQSVSGLSASEINSGGIALEIPESPKFISKNVHSQITSDGLELETLSVKSSDNITNSADKKIKSSKTSLFKKKAKKTGDKKQGKKSKGPRWVLFRRNKGMQKKRKSTKSMSNRNNDSSESSDTESADHGSTDKTSVAKLTESSKTSIMNKVKITNPFKKNKDKVTDSEPLSTVHVDNEKDAERIPLGDGRNADGVVYAELDLGKGGGTVLRKDDDKTEYAEIVHSKPAELKKEALSKSRENLTSSRENLADSGITTTPDGKKEAAV